MSSYARKIENLLLGSIVRENPVTVEFTGHDEKIDDDLFLETIVTRLGLAPDVYWVTINYDDLCAETYTPDEFEEMKAS